MSFTLRYRLVTGKAAQARYLHTAQSFRLAHLGTFRAEQ